MITIMTKWMDNPLRIFIWKEDTVSGSKFLLPFFFFCPSSPSVLFKFLVMRLFLRAFEKLFQSGSGDGEEVGASTRRKGFSCCQRRNFRDMRKQKKKEEKKMKRAVEGILVQSLDLNTIITNDKQFFQIRIKKDEEELDFMNLFVEIVGAGPVILSHRTEEKDGEEEIVIHFAFRISTAGRYFFHMRYLHLPLCASPYSITVFDTGLPNHSKISLAKTMLAIGVMAPYGARGWVDENTSFKVYSKSVGCLDQRLLHVLIDAPTGKTICPSTLVKCRHGIEVTYLTELVGAHWVNVFWDGYHIQGSPFKVSICRRAYLVMGEKDS